MLMYHATNQENLCSILSEGIKPSWDGVVYLTEKPEEAAMFVVLRQYTSIVSLAVEVDPNCIEESFDHSQKFFKCKAFMHKGFIEPDCICLEKSVKYDNIPSIIGKYFQ